MEKKRFEPDFNGPIRTLDMKAKRQKNETSAHIYYNFITYIV